MGLIKAIAGAVGGVLADQWKEYFYCDSLDSDTLMAKGQKRTSRRSSNRKGEDNIISNGAVIAVADGQCMMIVEQGKIVEFCAESGEFVWNSSTQPSIFAGSLGDSIGKTFREIGKRFTFGGSPASDQRVYYFNTKEIVGNKYGTVNPVPFRVVDTNIGLDVDISIRCNGEYSYKMINPMLFYTNVCGNVADRYDRSEIDSMLKTELLTALQPAMARISAMGVRYSALPGHTAELADALNAVLSSKWSETRGLAIASFGVNSVTASEEDETMIKTLQRTAVYRNTGMAGAALVDAQTEAMKAAASNENGAMMGFMGMNMAMQAGGTNAQTLFSMNNAQSQASGGQPAPKPGSWTCACGNTNTGKFCTECGGKKPADGWTCACGAINKGKFCSECGAKKPAGAPLYRCDKCGWEPEDPKNPPKFCPECGDVFNEEDVK
ncbi:MAG: SPFH domain-containing protein [Clostridia bacterium]|nr:SPFH domain-containing protein [Clostridia bacterium]